MIIEGSANLVNRVETLTLQAQYVEALILQNGRVIAISETAIALFKDYHTMQDPLGNSLLALETIPESHTFDLSAIPWVATHQAGFVEFSNGMGLLILPNDVRLYANKQDALKNNAAIVCLPLS